MKKKSGWRVAAVIAGLVTVLLVGAFYVYTLDYYRADAYAREMAAEKTGRVQQQGNMTVFLPAEGSSGDAALIFYPGGKVEDIAYAPLLKTLSDNGLTCVLLKMPFNLAVFDIKAADSVYARFPGVKNWYLGGHSLGGAMASSYVKDNTDKLSGLILLGAYPVNDSDIATLAIYGTEDVKLDLEKLATLQDKIEIAGGNHAYFGNYGLQKGDGTAAITREEQQAYAIDAILDFTGKKGG